MTSRRVPVVVILMAALVGLSLVDVGDRPPPRFGTAAGFVMPVADPASSLSSTWFCAASGDGADGADLTVVLANQGDQARAGTVTWVPAQGEPVVRPIQVGPRQGMSMGAADAVGAGAVSAVVELDGGDVGIEHAIGSGPGRALAPCASAASDRWYLADGATTRDASQVLALFNPFPDDAIVDITFSTDQGRDEPEGLQGLPVRAGSTTRVDLGEFVRRRAVTATSVVARSGRLVVDRLQRFDGSDVRAGTSLSLAAPAPGEVWTFPDGRYQEGLTERWHVYNPGEEDAVVIIEVVPDSGEVPIPVERTVPGRSQIMVDAAETAPAPGGVGHSSTVRSVNGVAVVVERELAGAAPSPRRGWSSVLGSPLAAPRWLLAATANAGAVDERLIVHNPGTEPVRFSVIALAQGRRAPVADLQGVELAPSQRREVAMGEVRKGNPLPLVVEADAPVVVERDLSSATDPGISSVIGIPLP
ncbi:MAG: DUF5719 family protein [Acidimicrobiales bacterium]